MKVQASERKRAEVCAEEQRGCLFYEASSETEGQGLARFDEVPKHPAKQRTGAVLIKAPN